ncbi:hypothetical protein B0H17DRAFT_1193901 [Mycena rosella]|uniref:SAP domain-containing protein n=1 Tax=Mycena rosella TaxID=1033263 RepID=A0AAD7GRY5_MYCRO|nr:hypothetical protein B0H17DRAFT_1193901 [Mycena rosella]
MTTPALQLSERPLKNKLMVELKQIAGAMGLDSNVTKDKLLASIEHHITATPQIAEDSRFLPLFAHRANHKSGAKNSVDKATEEVFEASKPVEAVTGANRALFNKGVKTGGGALRFLAIGFRWFSPGTDGQVEEIMAVVIQQLPPGTNGNRWQEYEVHPARSGENQRKPAETNGGNRPASATASAGDLR